MFTEALFMAASIPPLMLAEDMHLYSGAGMWSAAFC